MFNHSTSNRILGGSFSIVHGIQNNNNYYLHPESGGIVRFGPGEEWKEELYREYERIPRGRIKILKTIAENEVSRGGYSRNEDVRARRTVQLACIVNGNRESAPLLSVNYTGRDAVEAFKMEYIRYAQLSDASVAQLRGFNDSAIPTIIFHDQELIPARQIFEQYTDSVAALCYLWLQAASAFSNLRNKEHSTLPESYMEVLLYPNCENVWIRPETGMVCFGPEGPALPESRRFYCTTSTASEYPTSSVLSLGMYNEPNILQYLVQNYSSDSVLCLLSSRCNIGAVPTVNNLSTPQQVRGLWSRRSQQWSAMFPPQRLNLDHLRVCWWTDAPEPKRMDMEDGRSRFTLGEHWLEKYVFNFVDNSPDYGYWEWQWLSQAPHHFKATNTPREDWSLYDLRWEPLRLELRPVMIPSPDDAGARHTEVPPGEDDHIYSPYYLFFLPPLPLSSAPDLESWRRAQSFYYWSVDPEGASVMSEEQCISLGLPSYTRELFSLYQSWPAEVYDFMRLWQEAKGFDPTTTDFAQSLGYSILEVPPQSGDDRFETVNDADEEGLPCKAHAEDMDVDSFACNGSSSESHERPAQIEMDVEMNAVLEDMEVDR